MNVLKFENENDPVFRLSGGSVGSRLKRDGQGAGRPVGGTWALQLIYFAS